MKKKYYIARWNQAGQPSQGNVSFYAQSDYHAKLMANKIAREINLTNTPRTITESGRIVESINTGIN